MPKLRNPLSLDAFNNMYDYREPTTLSEASRTTKHLPATTSNVETGVAGIVETPIVFFQSRGYSP